MRFCSDSRLRIFFSLLLVAESCRVVGGVLADERPNVILFIADDVSWNDYGCYGNEAARTPNIDRLAANGTKFTSAYLTTSSCSPSRSSIVTGRYPHNNGQAAELHRPIAAHLPWLPELLREAGYYTALVGKHHMTTAAAQAEKPEPFELVDGGKEPGNSGGHASWVRTLKARPEDKPFFFWFAAYDAHRAWEADQEWDAEKYGAPHRPENVVVPPFLVGDQQTREDLASYYNEVTRFDYYTGEVVEALRAEGELENTLILVMADNGRPFPRAKTRLHDSGMKTALVAHWPDGIDHPGTPSGSLISAIDLAPTILAIAAAEIPETMQGVSMQPLFADPNATVRDYAFSEHNWHDYEAHGRSVRTQDYLYIRNARPSLAWQGPADSVRSPSHRSLQVLRDAGDLTAAQADVFLAPRPEVELYHTASDPHQLQNLAGDPQYAEVQQQLSNVLDAWIEQTGDSVPEELSSDGFDRDTGERLKEGDYYKAPPGSDRKATMINAPGPVRSKLVPGG